jgi:hypothetical protein
MLDSNSIDRLLSMLSMDHRQKSELIGKALASWDAMTSGNLGQNKWIQLCQPEDPSIYGQFAESSTTLRTLVSWAQADSPDDYQQWYQGWLIGALIQGTSGLEVDLSETLFRIYWLQNICARLDPPTWFVFNQTHWTMTDETDVFTHFITGLTRRYDFLRSNLISGLSASSDQRLKDAGEIVITGINRVLDKLKHPPFRTSLLRECRDRFFDPVSRKFDLDPSLIGCQNGIIEITPTPRGPPGLTFRRTQLDDYVSKQLGVAYRQPTPEALDELNTWLNQLFPQDQGNLLLQILYDGLIGQHNSIIPIFVGAIEPLNRLILSFVGTYGLLAQGALPKQSPRWIRFSIITLSEEPVSDDRLLKFLEQTGVTLLLSRHRPIIRTRVGRIRLIQVASLEPLTDLSPEVLRRHAELLAMTLLWRLLHEPITRHLHESINRDTHEFWGDRE